MVTRKRLVCFLIVYALGMVLRGMYVYLFYPVSPPLSDSPPAIGIVAWHTGKMRGIVSYLTPSQKWQLGISSVPVSDLEGVIESLSPVSVRGTALFVAVPISKTVQNPLRRLELWRWYPTWQKEKPLSLPVQRYEGLACSVNGKVLAYCVRHGKQTTLTVIEWKHNIIIQSRSVEYNRQLLQIACTDTGVVYLMTGRHILKYTPLQREETLSTHNTLIANAQGVFGIDVSLENGHTTMNVVRLDNRENTETFVCDLATPIETHPNSPIYKPMRLEQSLSSDSDRWWLLRVRVRERGAILILWKRGNPRPYYTFTNFSLFAPLAICEVSKK